MIDALQRANFAAVLHQLLYYALIAMLLGLVQFIESCASTIFRTGFVRNLRTALIAKLNRARIDSIAELTPGEINNRITGDVEALSIHLQYSLFPTLTSLVTLAATIAAMVRLDLRLAITGAAFSLLTLLPGRLSARRQARLYAQKSAASDEMFGQLQEGSTLQGISLFRNVHAKTRLLARFSAVAGKIFSLDVARSILGETTDLASSILGILGPAAVMAVGAYLVARHQITPGTIVTVLIYQSRIAGPFASLASLQVIFTTIDVVARRLLQIWDIPDELSGVLPFAAGHLRMQNISLSREQRTALHDVTLTVDCGSHVALVGPSGAGKSTVASLIVRLIDPDAGNIEIDGVNIRDISLESLRTSIALVQQEGLIVDASLFDNLTLMRSDADDSEIEAVINLCALSQVVAALPDGIQTRLGQRGFRLSGGERQRVCLARALLQNPQILILDEALSGVDVETEAKILHHLRRRYAGKTMIVITHRLASVAHYERMILMERGRIAATTTYEELATRALFTEAV